MKVTLRDDPLPEGHRFSSKIRLDEDERATLSPLVKANAHPTVVVKQRGPVGYDVHGNPEFGWETLVEGTAVVWSDRKERDDVSGKTLVVGRLVVLYDGEAPVDETAVVEHEWKGTFAVESVLRVGNRLEFERLVRLDVRDPGES